MKHKKTFLKGISFSYFYIFIYLGTGILTTPLLLEHFQADYFALLMLVYTIVTYLNNIRFGIPESLATILAKSKDNLLNTSLIKKSFFILFLFVIIALAVFYFLNLFISDWRIFLGDVYDLDKDDVLSVFFILIIFALIKIPFDLALSIFIGYHEVYLEKIYKTINLLANFALVLFVIMTGKSIIFFVIVAGFLDLLISLISFTHAIARYNLLKYKEVKKKITSIVLLKDGVLFFQLSMTQTIIWGAGILLVSHMLTLSDVTVYSLSMKIYIYIFYAYIIINTVIAPMYGKLFASGSWQEIRRIFNIMILLLPFLGGLIWICTLYFMSDIICLWTGSTEYYIGPSFVFFMGSFFYFTGYVNSYITLLYSIGKVKSIIRIRWNEVVLNLLISVIATYFLGLVGIAIGISLAIIVTSTRYLPRYIKEIKSFEIILDFTNQKKHFKYILIPNVFFAFLISNIIEIFIIKLLISFLLIVLYFFFSWNILPFKEKENIISLLVLRKGSTLAR